MGNIEQRIEQQRKRLDVLAIEQRKTKQTIKLLEDELNAIKCRGKVSTREV